jgi:hypothetical protein
MTKEYLPPHEPFGRPGRAILTVAVCIATLCAGLPTLAESAGTPEADCKSISGPDVILSDAQCQALQYFFSNLIGFPVAKITTRASSPLDAPWMLTEIMVNVRNVNAVVR